MEMSHLYILSRVNQIIKNLYKIAILHHGMQSFHMVVYCTPVYCTPVYCTLVYCTIADRSDRFATSISLRDSMLRNERKNNINLMLFNEIDNCIEVYNNSVIELIRYFGTSFFGQIDHLASSVIKFRPKTKTLYSFNNL